MTSNDLWTMAILGRRRVINAQYGLVVPLSCGPSRPGAIVLDGARVPVTRFRVAIPGRAAAVAYDRDGDLVAMSVNSQGERLELRRLDMRRSVAGQER